MASVERREVEWLPLDAAATPCPPFFPPLSSCRTVAILGDTLPRMEQLAASLAAGAAPLLRADPMKADVLVMLHGIHPAPAEAAFAELTRLASRPSPPRVLIGAALDDPDGAAFTGLVKTAALEWSADWKCLTIDSRLSGDETPSAIASELARGGTDREVRVGPFDSAQGRPSRAVRIRVPRTLASEHRTLTQGAWVVSGGARGVTAACCLELARAGARRIALLGRTSLDDEPAVCRGLEGETAIKRALIGEAGSTLDLRAVGRQVTAILARREIRATIAALEATGAEVRYESLDVADAAAVRHVIADIRHAWGPIRGLVHAAGVLADKRLGEKTLEQFAGVLRTKIGGARALLDACAHDPLEQICFFSSVAAHAGNAGQSDYAAANAALDRMALDEQARRGADCHVVSIAWGPWDGGMVTASLARHFTARGIGLIPLQAGARAFVEELRSGGHVQVIVGCGLEQVREPEPSRLRFDRQAIPMLADHRIDGAIVLPMTFALDALFDAGRRALGSHCEARDLRVLQGVVFDGDHAELEVRSEIVAPGHLLATLLHASGRPAYRAEFVAAQGPAPSASRLAKTTSALPDVCRQPYAAALFHGSAFYVIREVLDYTDEVISARVATASGMGWQVHSQTQWQIDPAALDGALQLLRVWGVAQDGRPSLPTRIGRCRVWAPWPANGEVGCIVACRRDSVHRLNGDALFVDLATGAPLLSLDGIEMHFHAERE